MIKFKYFEDIFETNGEVAVKYTEKCDGRYNNPDYKANTITVEDQLNLFFKKNVHIEFVSLCQHTMGYMLTYQWDNKRYSNVSIEESIDELRKF